MTLEAFAPPIEPSLRIRPVPAAPHALRRATRGRPASFIASRLPGSAWLLAAAGLLASMSLLAAASGRAETQGETQAAPQDGPVRVATLLPFVEEALALAPEQARVVASVRRELHRAPAEGVIDLGNPHSPSFEALARARAGLVVGDRAIHAPLESRLEPLGAELILIDTSSVTSTLDALARISRSLGGMEALDSRIEQTRLELEGLALEEPVSLLPLFGAPGSFYAMSDRVWLGDLARRLGFENVTPARGDERFPGLVALSDEVMAMMRPDLVVLVAHGDPRKIREDLVSRTARGGAWAALERAPLGIHVLDPRLFSANPGLELGAAARILVGLVDEGGESDERVASSSGRDRTDRTGGDER